MSNDDDRSVIQFLLELAEERGYAVATSDPFGALPRWVIFDLSDNTFCEPGGTFSTTEAIEYILDCSGPSGDVTWEEALAMWQKPDDH